MSSSEIFQLCANQCEETAEKLGMECDVFFSNGDEWTLWHCCNPSVRSPPAYGSSRSSHTPDTPYPACQKLQYNLAHPELKIVTFDTQFRDASGQVQEIEGVTQFFQDDADPLLAVCLEIRAGTGFPLRIILQHILDIHISG